MDEQEIWVHGWEIYLGMNLAKIDPRQVVFVARDGQIKAIADALIVNHDINHSDSWTEQVELPQSFWVQFIGAVNKSPNDWLVLVNWDTSSFAFINENGSSIKATGVRFARSQVLKMFPGLLPGIQAVANNFPILPGSTAPNVKKAGAGRKPSKPDWENFAAALAVVIARDPQPIEEEGRSARSVYDRVALVLQERLGADAQYLSYDSATDALIKAAEWIREGMPDPRTN